MHTTGDPENVPLGDLMAQRDALEIQARSLRDLVQNRIRMLEGDDAAPLTVARELHATACFQHNCPGFEDANVREEWMTYATWFLARRGQQIVDAIRVAELLRENPFLVRVREQQQTESVSPAVAAAPGPGEGLNTSNDFAVGVQGGHIVVLRDVRRPMTPDDAIRFAAHLVVLAEGLNMTHGGQFGPMFGDYVKAIKDA